MFNASAIFRRVPVGWATSITNRAAWDCVMPGSVPLQTGQHWTWLVTQQSLQGRPLSQGFLISSPKSPSTPFINVIFPLWVALCSLWLRVNHNSYGASPQCYFKRYHKWGKRKKKSDFLSKHQAISNCMQRFGDQAHLAAKEPERSNSPQSK